MPKQVIVPPLRTDVSATLLDFLLAMNDAELVILTISVAVFSSLFIGGAFVLYVRSLRISNIERRQAILDVLRTPAGSPRSFVGFFHPFW